MGTASHKLWLLVKFNLNWVKRERERLLLVRYKVSNLVLRENVQQLASKFETSETHPLSCCKLFSSVILAPNSNYQIFSKLLYVPSYYHKTKIIHRKKPGAVPVAVRDSEHDQEEDEREEDGPGDEVDHGGGEGDGHVAEAGHHSVLCPQPRIIRSVLHAQLSTVRIKLSVGPESGRRREVWTWQIWPLRSHCLLASCWSQWPNAWLLGILGQFWGRRQLHGFLENHLKFLVLSKGWIVLGLILIMYTWINVYMFYLSTY